MKYFPSRSCLLLTIGLLVLKDGSNCEQLSTIFILETSDSSPSLVSNDRDSSSSSQTSGSENKLTDQNTRIISDEPSDLSQKPPKDSQVVVIHHNNHDSGNHNKTNSHSTTSHHAHSNNSSVVHSSNQHKQTDHNSSHQQTSGAHSDHHANKERDLSSSRRLDEESHINHQAHGSHSTRNTQVNRVKSTTTTTASPYDDTTERVRSVQSTPKAEERLLISITSDDDDDYRPPQKQTAGVSSSSSSSQDDELRPPNQPHKRKPSITISIQDANIGKQNGASGASAVIVRPSENGQSIVISTQGGGGGVVSSSGQSSNKPTFSIVSSSGEHHLNHNNNHNQQQVRPVSSSTYRPPLNEEYNPVSSRPIVSTLVDPPRLPNQQQVNTDERPQRPVVSDLESSGSQDGGQQRPISQPVNRPPSQEPSNHNFNQYQEDSASSQRPSSGESKFPLNEKNCGLVHETKIVGGDEADPADFLWMAAIIKSKPTENLAPRDVLVRLGSYDFDDATASSLSADYAIDQFRVPAHYSKKTHASDIAIMRLKTPLQLTDNYKTVCMPQARRSYVGAYGTVTGYGSQSQTFRKAAPKLRQVTVPIWENRKCSVVYKRNLTESFLCAGYEEGGKDACQGDSGGPLMTEGPNERMMVVGVVSHGIGCGAPGYPGVYTRITTYLDWIEKNTRE